MYYPNERHRVLFNGVDVENAHMLITSDKPIVTPPEAKTEYVEILGADGLLDLTDGVDGVPHFNNRELTLNFIVKQNANAVKVLHNLTALYHNRRVLIRLLDDDPQYGYTGRLTVNPIEHDGHFHRLTITANIDTTAYLGSDDEYISVPDWGADDHMIDVPGWGGDDWVTVPAWGGESGTINVPEYSGWIDVPPHGANDWTIQVPGWGDGGTQVPDPGGGGGGTVPVPDPGG